MCRTAVVAEAKGSSKAALETAEEAGGEGGKAGVAPWSSTCIPAPTPPCALRSLLRSLLLFDPSW